MSSMSSKFYYTYFKRHYFKYVSKESLWIECSESEREFDVDIKLPASETYNRFHAGWDRNNPIKCRLSGTKDLDCIPEQIREYLNLSKELQGYEDVETEKVYQSIFQDPRPLDWKAQVDELKIKMAALRSR